MMSVRSLCVAVTLGVAVTLSQAQPSAAQSYNWSGLYAGASLGGAWSTSEATDVLEPFGGHFTNGLGDTFHFGSGGVAGGGQLGYQFQFGHWVLGAEVAGTWTDLIDNHDSTYLGSDRVEMRISPILTATARLGYAWDRWLGYVKGGYAGADVDFRAFDDVNGVGLLNTNHWVDGYTVGAGLEYALFEGVRIGVDYSYVDLQSYELSTRTNIGGSEHFETPAEVHAVTARLNFQLGGGFQRVYEPVYEPMK
jgi:outer membrane immunogenic protein